MVFGLNICGEWTIYLEIMGNKAKQSLGQRIKQSAEMAFWRSWLF
jgi:hypothetical protein